MKTQTENELFERYEELMNSIGGWYNKGNNPILRQVDGFQQEEKIEGHLGEIGVYHGKSFIPLLILRRGDEKAIAIDCFEQQTFNVDNSGGSGASTDIFLSNIQKILGEENADLLLDNEKLVIHTADSQKMTSEDVVNLSKGRYRLFSIDGCHTVQATLHDLEIVEGALATGGVVVIDDYHNHDWPGVKMAVDLYFNFGRLVPFFIEYSLNKMLLCEPEYWRRYFDLIKGIHPNSQMALEQTLKRHYSAGMWDNVKMHLS